MLNSYGRITDSMIAEDITAQNFSTDKYRGISLLKLPTGQNAILFQHDSAESPHWSIYIGMAHALFFRTYKEMKDFCYRQHIKVIKNRKRGN